MEHIQSKPSVPEQSWLYKAIRIYPHELSRTFVVWIIRFLYRFAFVVSWTLVVAHIAASSHTETSLPLLFLFHAALVLCGSLLSTALFRRFHLEHVFLGSIFFGLAVLIIFQFLSPNDTVRTGALLFVESFLLVQLSINIETFTERLFSPLESSRTFPVVESGDTIATLLAGFFLFVSAADLSLSRAIWVVIISLSLLIPLFLQYHLFVKSVPGLCLFRKQLIGHHGSHAVNSESVERFRLKAILKKHPYVSTLVVIVLAQWFFTVVLEYLFTYSVSLAASSSELVPAASGAVENVLVHEFGFLQIILAGAALISNLFFTGRMLSAFGVVGSILLHPLVSLLSLAAMVLHFGYFTTVVSRINAEVTGVVYRNAYQSTYYIFDEAESQFTRIFLDGVVRPVGSLVGTFFLLVSYFFVSPAYFITALLVGVFFVLLFFLLASMKLQKQHTHLVLSKLMSPSASRELRLSLLDVVAQNHFSLDAPYALDLYHSSQEFPLLRVKLLKLFSQRREHLDLIFESLNSESPEIRFAALDSLTLLLESGFFSEQLLSRRELISRLKKRYIDEQDSDLRFSLVILLAKMKDKPVLDFLLSLLETEQGDMLGNAILACDFYGDPSFTPFIEPFLASDDPRIWGNAAVVLGKHESYRSLIRKKLDSSLSLDTHAVRVTIPFVLGVLRDDTYSAHLLRRLDESNSPEEKLLATFALVQMGAPFALQHFIDQAFMSQFHEPSRIFRLLQAFSARERFVVEKIIQQRTMTELHHCFRKFSATRLDKLSRVDLQYLRKLYSFLHATESIAEIDEILSSKHGISRHDIRHFVSLPLTLSAYV